MFKKIIYSQRSLFFTKVRYMTVLLIPGVLKRDKELRSSTFDSIRFSSSDRENNKNKPIDIIHPCTDYGFKRVFYDQEVACGCLNTLLNFEGARAITSLTYLDKELLSKDKIGSDFIVDILAQSQDGRRFLIEMQTNYTPDYAMKAFVEFCRLIAEWDTETIHQMVSEEKREKMKGTETFDGTKQFWADIKTAIVIVLTNTEDPGEIKKTLFTGHMEREPSVINTYRMLHEDKDERQPTRRPLGDFDGRIVLVTLANFKKTESELVTPLDRWLYAFKDERLNRKSNKRLPLYKTIHNTDAAIGNNESLRRFYDLLNKESFPKESLERMERTNIILTNELNVIKKEEFDKGVLNVARSMLKTTSASLSVQQISEITGLSLSELEKLQSESNK